MKPEDAALIMGIDTDEFKIELEDQGSELSRAYKKGFLLSKIEINKSIVLHAKAGSSPAQSLAARFINEIELLSDE